MRRIVELKSDDLFAVVAAYGDGLGGGRCEAAGHGDESEHGLFRDPGVDAGRFDLSRNGDTLGGILQHEDFHVRIAQNVLPAKPRLNDNLRLLCRQSFDADSASDGQDDLSALVHAEFFRKLGSVEDANIKKVADIEE